MFAQATVNITLPRARSTQNLAVSTSSLESKIRFHKLTDADPASEILPLCAGLFHRLLLVLNDAS